MNICLGIANTHIQKLGLAVHACNPTLGADVGRSYELIGQATLTKDDFPINLRVPGKGVMTESDRERLCYPALASMCIYRNTCTNTHIYVQHTHTTQRTYNTYNTQNGCSQCACIVLCPVFSVYYELVSVNIVSPGITHYC